MDEFVEVARVSEIPPGRVVARLVGERKIALCHTPSGFFALDNSCPHRGGPLSEGDVLGEEVVCPWHLWGFDASTGRCLGNPDVSVITHAVRLEGDRIFVRLTPQAVAAAEAP